MMLTARARTSSLCVSGEPFRRRHGKGITVAPVRPGFQRQGINRSSTLCHALKNQDLSSDFMSRVERMSEKYDFLSAFTGSILVTGYFVFVHGQDVGTALGITSMATVTAVVLEEFIFDSPSS